MKTHSSTLFHWGLLLSWFLLLSGPSIAKSQDLPVSQQWSKLPGATTAPTGKVEKKRYAMAAGPACEQGTIVVPENRFADRSRNIKLYFFQLKARKPEGLAPIFMLPGGPGGYFAEKWVNGLRRKPRGFGSNAEAWLYTQNRDLVLVNQRGASLPDRSFQQFVFFARAASLRDPYSSVTIAKTLKKGVARAVDYWSGRKMDLAGYDIMNMVEDINDLREALGYKKIVLRGTSFGSQWSFAYIKQHAQHVDRAILSGIEPLDHGYDSHKSVWNVFRRLESRLEEANDENNSLNLPADSLTDAIKKVVKRLEAKPIEIEAQHPKLKLKRKILIGHEDFQQQLRQSILASGKFIDPLSNLHRFVLEVYNQDYRYLASRAIAQRIDFGGVGLQLLLINNSLGISGYRDAKLDNEPARRWLGELNIVYKATRGKTPTAVVPDSFRKVKTDIPILFVQGDMDLSTPVENAEEALDTLPNAHMIRIIGGNHGAFDQAHQYDQSFMHQIQRFLEAEFSPGTLTVHDLDLPTEVVLPRMRFKPVGSPSLYDEMVEK